MAEIDYPKMLEEAWNQHLAEREPEAPTVISLFAGCGGSSLGYSMAGFRELLAVEWNDNAVETFRLNFPGVPVYHGDIHKLTVGQCLKMTGLQPGELDILDGSPPCQGFSTAGKRQLNDSRNQLFREFVRLLRGLRPRVFVMENVSGLIKGKMKLIFAEMMRELKASGYQVRCQLMNTKYFNVPQSRQRLIWIGARDGMGNPTFPIPIMRSMTFREAIIGLMDMMDRELPSIIAKYAKIHPGGWNTDPSRYETLKGNRASSISLKWADWNRTCGTLPKQEISLTGIVHPNKRRYLNIQEAKRIGGFPDTFQVMGSRRQQWSRVGNSVPPLFMRAIANHIRREILCA